MLTPDNAQLSSPTDRAVKIAAAVLLPAVFGFFFVRHLWLTPEVNRERQAISVRSPIDMNHIEGKTVSVDVVEASTPQVVQSLELTYRPVFLRVSLATSVDVTGKTFARSHAPQELTEIGRIVADPLAFAPRSLPERELQVLHAELAEAAELNLYGDELDSKRRI